MLTNPAQRFIGKEKEVDLHSSATETGVLVKLYSSVASFSQRLDLIGRC